MRKNRGLLFLPVVALFSCGAWKFDYVPYQYGKLQEDPFVRKRHDGYYLAGDFSKIETSIGEFDPTMASLLSIGGNRKAATSTGDVNLTVIPVDFSDYPADELEQTHGGQAIDMIRGAFFGSQANNQYVSVAEFFASSSYDRLHLKGEVVSSWFRPKETLAELKSKHSSSATKSALTSIYNQAIDWYNARGGEKTLTAGDPIHFVYCAPYSGYDGGVSDRASMLWAFTINEPAPAAWSSFFMGHPNQNKMDAHTFIHETGHLFGLKDYYDTNAVTDFSSISPLGRMDMMDCSLGDHNAFSKMTLNWARPYVPTKDCVITLRQSVGNGDSILLSPSWGGSPFEEYLLLEFYTPSGLNRVDTYLRDDPSMRLMNKAGVKVYHVDARLGVFEERKTTPIGFLKKDSDLTGKLVDFYQNNSSSSSQYLINLLDASASSSKLVRGYVASDHIEARGNVNLRDVLFQEGDGTESAVFKDFTFHDGREMNFDFKVTEVGATYAKVSVTMKGVQ